MTAQLYTASRLRVLRSCMRLHHYRYNLAIRTPETDAMLFGTIGHKALEAYYRAWRDAITMFGGIDISDALQRERFYEACCARLPSAIAVIDAADGLSPWDRIKLRVLISAYHARWGACDWEILAVEAEFRFMLGDHLIGGKIDAIIRDRKDNRVYVVEHKTTGSDASLGSAYWDRLAIDTQVSIYIDGATMLGYDVSGCIYDVLKRPAHDGLLATPEAKRKYTAGRGCKRCGGSAKPGAIERGRGHYDVAFASVVEHVQCSECDGTGWKKNKDGMPEAPRLHSDQRDTDESEEAFEARVVEAVTEDPDAFLMRGVVVRLDDELPAMRQDLLDAIAIEQTGLIPRNPNECAKRSQMCSFFDACSGRASIDDEERFPRGLAHPELEAAQ